MDVNGMESMTTTARDFLSHDGSRLIIKNLVYLKYILHYRLYVV
jgi:hypothetical protein